jgi:hypothetical protein
VLHPASFQSGQVDPGAKPGVESFVAAKRIGEEMRVLCDFIAGMTDRYAIEFHAAIAGDGMSIFKLL